MAEKKRLDILLFEKGLCESREKAKQLIKSGAVYVNSAKCDKPSILYDTESNIALQGGFKYVSRGGLKLEKAIELYSIKLCNMVCMDIGASTGGFTDCMLQNGAKKVYAVDVGHDQLSKSLADDHRVVNMESTNIRNVTRTQINEPINFASVDVSFISLTLVLPVLFELLSDKGEAICLVKPQFEAGRENVGKKGVVRKLSTHIEVCLRLYDFLAEQGFCLAGATFSPIKGPEGNIEYLYYIKKNALEPPVSRAAVESMVKSSHELLD